MPGWVALLWGATPRVDNTRVGGGEGLPTRGDEGGLVPEQGRDHCRHECGCRHVVIAAPHKCQDSNAFNKNKGLCLWKILHGVEAYLDGKATGVTARHRLVINAFALGATVSHRYAWALDIEYWAVRPREGEGIPS